jgi:hypothetical protein
MSRTKMLRAIAAGAAFASLLTGPVAGRDNSLKLPACGKKHEPVTLQIITDAHIGWKVNALNAQAESNAAWFPIPPSNWIGRHQHQAGNFAFVIHFSAIHPHGAMSVSAQWSADNCGVSLQGGTGTPVSTGACYEGNADFKIGHTTNANFAPADVTNPNPSITFVSSDIDTLGGITGIFTVTAECPGK